MTDFTELPGQWRKDAKEAEAALKKMRQPEYFDEKQFINNARLRIYQTKECARMLATAIPKWKTLDPNDESTWPEDGKVYLVSTRGSEEFAEWQVSGFGFDVFACDGWIGINDCVIQYRERCSIDSPHGNVE